jgi:hypothetical protein
MQLVHINKQQSRKGEDMRAGNENMRSVQRMVIEEHSNATASNGKGAVMVAEMFGAPTLVKLAPLSLGGLSRRAEYIELFDAAAARIGFKRDKRCRSGWRRVR